MSNQKTGNANPYNPVSIAAQNALTDERSFETVQFAITGHSDADFLSALRTVVTLFQNSRVIDLPEMADVLTLLASSLRHEAERRIVDDQVTTLRNDRDGLLRKLGQLKDEMEQMRRGQMLPKTFGDWNTTTSGNPLSMNDLMNASQAANLGSMSMPKSMQEYMDMEQRMRDAQTSATGKTLAQVFMEEQAKMPKHEPI